MTHLTDQFHRDAIYVGGSWIPSTGSNDIEVIEPATRAALGSVPRGTVEDVDLAVHAARDAFDSWAATSPDERAKWAERIAEAIEARREDFAVTMTRELGMPLDQCRTMQVNLGLSDLRGAAGGAREIAWEEQVGNSRVVRVPVGVVGAITPWNYPLHQVTSKVAAAITAGCTVVVKPSEVTPFTAYLFLDVLHELGLPAGVVNLVPGLGVDVGEALVSHVGVDAISFTGSTAAGRRISEVAAARVKPLTMELGGKSASVILADADLDEAVTVSMNKAFQNCGQTCNALTRMLVPRSKLAEVEAIAARHSETFVPGDPFSASATLGPVVSETQRDRIHAYIDQGVAEGAVLLIGGKKIRPGLEDGFFVEPTVFSNVKTSMVIAQEEIFGPVLAILPYDTEDEAVEIANDSDYGLAGAVWSADPAHALAVARRIRAGQVAINGGSYNAAAPFGGFKQSGHGREAGKYGVEDFLTYISFQF